MIFQRSHSYRWQHWDWKERRKPYLTCSGAGEVHELPTLLSTAPPLGKQQDGHSPGLTTAGAPSLSMAASTSYCYLLDCGAHCKILGCRLSFKTDFEGLPWGAKTPKSQYRVRSTVMQLDPTCHNEEFTRRNKGLHAITRTQCSWINNKHLKELWEILPNVSLSSEWAT